MKLEKRTIGKETLPNGLTVITEAMPQVRSVTVGIWVRGGSRIEPAPLNGISHFIEHMAFKGTSRRTAEEIAREGDALGGTLDAFTSKEMVCFNAKVLDEHLPRAFDILADLVTAPLFREEDIEKERNVVLEEIKMDEDNPDYLVHEIFTQNFWRGHAIGRPILGTKRTLAGFGREVVSDFFRRWYAPNHILITAAGHLEHEGFVELVGRHFLPLQPFPNGYQDSPPGHSARVVIRSKRDLEQIHLCVGVPSYPMGHEQRYTVAVLNTILGGGMSSRLFQNIREREGLAYAIFSDLQAYRDTGCMTIYAGTAQEKAAQAVRLILRELNRLKREPVAAEELRRAQDNLKASLMISLESTNARMSNLARQEFYFARFFSFDEILAGIDTVTREQVQAVAQEFFRPELVGMTVLGQVESFEVARDELAP
ncbi:MAG: M16 family metallopeptidase [Candidatus Acidiferrales bacterium]